ncbi:hypothetical protein PLICRDRAFT_351986 [Plicaturopsis crispa FD-325 SS-3]|uniref:F-box domain-containing protein n=1 Tax=Plicaturopsis crispa FD-325 SS-3 TaxID=944288 RepID=A0A0C9SKY3_PLICR|nr:hypothetical protein PLICRDRAFT_351986 [Plicaturopsis crispa FD-325 SS-3]
MDQNVVLGNNAGAVDKKHIQGLHRSPQQNLCPIDSLPFEVLGLIFSCCFLAEDEDIHSPHPRSAPLVFCNVCHYWRDIASSIPALWSHFRISVGGRSACMLDNLKWTARWLANSRSLPLAVTLDACLLKMLPFPGRTISRLTLLQPFNLDPPENPYPGDVAHCVSELTSIHYRSYNHTRSLSRIEAEWLWWVLTEALNLRFLQWDAPLIYEPASKDGQWRALQRLCISSPVHTGTAMDILCDLTSLKSVQLELKGRFLPIEDLPIPCAALTSLTLSVYDGDVSFVEMLESLTFPALRTLDLTCRSLLISPLDRLTEPMPAVLSLVARSHAPLGSISLTLFSMREDQVVQLLELTSHSLEALSIEEPDHSYVSEPPLTLTDHLWERMTRREDSAETHLAPHLTFLSLLKCNIQSTDGVLADMVQSRLCPAIESLYISSLNGERHLADLERLGQLFAEGELEALRCEEERYCDTDNESV